MRRAAIRWTYLAALASMLVWISTSLVGGYVYKSADGLVVGDAGVVSPEYTVTVLSLEKRNGDFVEKGEVVARVSSTRVAETVASLSMQASTLISRMAEVNSKAEIMDQLVQSAEVRDRVVTASNERLQVSKEKGYLPALTENAVADQVFRGKQELAVLKAERVSLSDTIAQVVAASRFTDQALKDILFLFDAGKMKAPMSGFISGVEAGIGSVVNPGMIVAEMVGTERFVLMYVPVNRLYALKADAPVTIEVGFGNWLHGRISRIEPIAARLPKEFQKTLSPVERQQLVRVDFDAGVTPPPFFSKVTVR